MATYLGGKVDVSLNQITIPARLLSDSGVVTTIEYGTREIASLGGTFTQPNGRIETATAVFSVLLPSMDYLKNLFPDIYQAGTGAQTVGRVEFGGDDCTVQANTPVVIHYSCEENSDNDIFIPNGTVQYNASMTQNASDPVMVEITVMAQPDDTRNGIVAWAGTGSLTEKTIWNATTEAYEPVAS